MYNLGAFFDIFSIYLSLSCLDCVKCSVQCDIYFTDVQLLHVMSQLK